MTPEIPRNLKTFIFKPKLSFLSENDKNYDEGEFWDFMNSPKYNISEFSENGHSDNDFFLEKSKIHQSYHFGDFSKMTIET